MFYVQHTLLRVSVFFFVMLTTSSPFSFPGIPFLQFPVHDDTVQLLDRYGLAATKVLHTGANMKLSKVRRLCRVC